MWSGALVSCGRGFLSLTLELEAQPILILSRPCLFKALLLPFLHSQQSGEIQLQPDVCVCDNVHVCLCRTHADLPT